MEHTIKEWRELRGISQGELADLIGKSQVTVSHWETGKATPTKLKDLTALKQVLKLKSKDGILLPDGSTLI